MVAQGFQQQGDLARPEFADAAGIRPSGDRFFIELEGLELVRGKRVLVVDDDESIRELIQLGLASEGYSVESAPTGSAALAALAAKPPPDVLFLDLNLPDMNGFEILGKLEKNSEFGAMRVFILTGRNLGPEQLAELESKAVKVIEKGSVSLTAILETLKEKLQALAVAK